MFRNVFSPFHPRRCVRFLELPQLFQPPLLGCAFGGLRCGCGGQLRGQFLNLTFSTRVGQVEGKTMGQATCDWLSVLHQPSNTFCSPVSCLTWGSK